MKTVRIFFKKTDRLKFISHLDMTRVMSRLIVKSKIPVWYTEGFNQHVYMNFAVPLSLGFEGIYEILEIRLIDDNYSNNDCLLALQKAAMPGLEFVAVKDPIMPMKDIAFAKFELDFGNNATDLKDAVTEFLKRDSIICQKKGKKGKIKEIDIIPKISSYSWNNNLLTLVLTAGNEDNLNPTLVMDRFFEENESLKCFYSVTRTGILDKDKNNFI